MARYKYECSGCRAIVYFDQPIDTERFYCPDTECGHFTLILSGYTENDCLELLELHQKIEDLRERVDAICAGEDGLMPAHALDS